MDEHASAPLPTGGEQRTLASIMFTDVVAFSKHSAINEERTYRALNRDFDLIYKAVAEHNGQVLNTMGDGMMVIFMSAIQCVQCAIVIQGELYRQMLNNPVDGVLQHRLGLHVGDIILNGKNTMGDGVNQAARIQALARPDSIAMSREFHKMVENKTPFKAKYLGPQRAKNIHDAIPIWEISPIDDEIRQRAADALFTPAETHTKEGATGRRGALTLVAVLMLLVLVFGMMYMMKSAAKSAAELARQNGRGLAEGKSSEKDLRKINKNRFPGLNSNNSTAVSNNEATTPPKKASASLSLNASEVQDVAAKTNSHDYAGVADVLRRAAGADSDEGKVMIKKYDDLTAFQKWLDNEVSKITPENPLMMSLDGESVKVFSSKDGTVIDNGTPVTRNLWEYKNSTIYSLAETLATKMMSGNPDLANTSNWLATFKDVHKI